MVAYSFKAAFVRPIEQRIKRQTIRLPRRRHAQPGERIQLFVGMRTKTCRKIIPDPVCLTVGRVVIDTRSGALDHVEVDGIVLPMGSADLEDFARADGFSFPAEAPAARVLERWWLMTHGRALHEDLVLIRWEDRP